MSPTSEQTKENDVDDESVAQRTIHQIEVYSRLIIDEPRLSPRDDLPDVVE